MDDRAAGEVDRGDLGGGVPDAVHQAGGAPDHVGEREVDEEHPSEDEGHQGRELEALSRGAEDQGRGDDGEGQLEDREDILGDPVGVAGVRIRGDSLKEEILGSSQEGAREVRSEDQAVADGPPDDGDHGSDAEAHRDDGEDVLRADQTSVEEGQTGEGHHQHQKRRDHHPGVVAGDGCRGDVRRGRITVGDGGQKVSILDGHRGIGECNRGRCRSCGCVFCVECGGDGAEHRQGGDGREHPDQGGCFLHRVGCY